MKTIFIFSVLIAFFSSQATSHAERQLILGIRGGGRDDASDEEERIVKIDRKSHRLKVIRDKGNDGEGEKIAFLPRGSDETVILGDGTTKATRPPVKAKESFKRTSNEITASLREKFADASRLLELPKIKPVATNFANEMRERYGETTSKLQNLRSASVQSARNTFQRLKVRDTAIPKESFFQLLSTTGKILKDKILGLGVTKGLNGDVSILVAPFILSLVGSSLGFYSFLYFVSVGFSAAIGIIAAVALIVANSYSPKPITRLANFHTFLTLLWSLRLTTFLLHREFINWPDWHTKLLEVNERATTQSKVNIWLTCGSFYSLMVLPCIYRLRRNTEFGIVGKIGVFLQVLGLSLETIADYQKGVFKKQEGNRYRFCAVGIWSFSTAPNYLGEILFWCGTYIAGVGSFSSFLEWTASTVGLLFLLVVMKGAIDSLASKHMKNYGLDEDFLEFRQRHNILGYRPSPRRSISLPL